MGIYIRGKEPAQIAKKGINMNEFLQKLNGFIRKLIVFFFFPFFVWAGEEMEQVAAIIRGKELWYLPI